MAYRYLRLTFDSIMGFNNGSGTIVELDKAYIKGYYDPTVKELFTSTLGGRSVGLILPEWIVRNQIHAIYASWCISKAYSITNTSITSAVDANPNGATYNMSPATVTQTVDDSTLNTSVSNVRLNTPVYSHSISSGMEHDRSNTYNVGYTHCIFDVVWRFGDDDAFNYYKNAFPWCMNVEEVTENWQPERVDNWIMDTNSNNELPYQKCFDMIPAHKTIPIAPTNIYAGDELVSAVYRGDDVISDIYAGGMIV